MKMRFVGCLFLMLHVYNFAPVLAQEACPAFEGTWKYVSDTAEGMFISTDKHMVSIQVKKNRDRFDNYQLTEVEKAEAFSNTFLQELDHGPVKVTRQRTRFFTTPIPI